MDRVDGLIAVVQILQDLLHAVGEGPSSRLKLGCYSIALQVPHPADHEGAVLADEPGRPLSHAPAARCGASCRAGSRARPRPRFVALFEARSHSGAPIPG